MRMSTQSEALSRGVAIGTSNPSSAVITGLVIGLISIPVAWASSFLKPPVAADAIPAAETV
jgi:DHA1 family inner membrane transport protein